MTEKAGVTEGPSLDKEWDYLHWETLLAIRAQSMGRDQNELVWKMRALPADLVMAYRETEFVLDIGVEECVVRIPSGVPKSLTKFLKSQKAKTWSIISAYNPYSRKLSTDENQRRESLLQQLMAVSQCKFYPAVGRSVAGDWQEPSLLVLDLSYDMARAIGTAFGQNAVVFGERGAVVEMIFCDR